MKKASSGSAKRKGPLGPRPIKHINGAKVIDLHSDIDEPGSTPVLTVQPSKARANKESARLKNNFLSD